MSQAIASPSVTPSFPPLAYQGVPVLTTEMLAQAYEVEAKQIRQNFANNRERFVEGKHFFIITNGELKNFRLQVENFDSQISPKVRSLTLWTERGAARNAKMLNSDRAWDVFELLEETFFRVVRADATPATALDAAISPAERAELKAIVDAKLSTYSASVQGKARAEIWTRFNRHFRIAEYAQLPTVKMSEARDYLIQMEVKALGAAAQPTATAAIPALVSDDAEGHLAAIRQHVRHIYDHEAALYGIVRHNLPSLWDIQGRERRIALRALDSMERASGALESILVCLESSTRTALAAGRA